MDPETQHDFENEQQFWDALEEILSRKCESHSEIDDALRSYLTTTTTSSDYVQNDYDVRRCAYNLYFSQLFAQHSDYIRRQFVYCLLQEDEVMVLHMTATLLLLDAREHEDTFTLLNDEGIFPRLVEMIAAPRQLGEEDLHRQLMELLYEMARVQRIANDDLICIDDDFVSLLFDIIEQVSGDVEDPYHYPVIRVLLVLNEQFMVAAHEPMAAMNKSVALTNKVMKVLSAHGSRYKTFGENIILLLNREDETSLQLLTLKLLYLLFTTPPTYEYFYTNDLHVLVDILIRNLLDLPEEASALRHTYLRVFYPLLEYTQLKHPPHYKQNEVRKLLAVLAGGQVLHGSDSPSFSHFEEVDETTKRLVHRCQTVGWLQEVSTDVHEPESPDTPDFAPSSLSKTKPPALPISRKLRKRTISKNSGVAQDFLAPQLESARQSSLSVAELANQREKPGVITPSRNPSVKAGLKSTILHRNHKPPPPKARRSGLTKLKTESKIDSEAESTEPPAISNPDDRQSTSPQQQSAEAAIETDQNVQHVKKPKAPPPAPKARRWRGKKKQEMGISQTSESTSDAATLTDKSPLVGCSPFSPIEDKTLSPYVHDDALPATKSKRMSSVSAALEQAQAQALHDLENTLEKATIYEAHEDSISDQSSTLHRQALLAPPSQPPHRIVPAPKVEIENMPRLAPEQPLTTREEMTQHDDRIEEESEDEWN